MGTLHSPLLPPPGPHQVWQDCNKEVVMAISPGLAATITGTCSPLALQGDLYPLKSTQNRTRREPEGPVHAKRNQREAEGLYLQDGEALER